MKTPTFATSASAFLAASLLAATVGAQSTSPTPGTPTSTNPTSTNPTSTGDTIVATWQGGQLLQSDYESWRAFHQYEDDPATIRELAYLESMARNQPRDSDDDLRTRIELEVARQRILSKALRLHTIASVTVDDEEVEALFRDNPDAFQRPAKMHLRNLYKRLPEGEEAEAVRARMDELHQRLLKGDDFEQLARQESESQTRFRGGNLGFIDVDELPPSLVELVGRLQPGQVSAPVEHTVQAEGRRGRGITIFYCEELRPGQALSPQEVRQRMHARLLRQHQLEAWETLQNELLTAAAPRLTPESSTIVFELPGCRATEDQANPDQANPNKHPDCWLSTRGLAMLSELKRGPLPEAATSNPQARQSLVHSWALGVLSARRAVELGLDEQPEIAAALRWERLDVLAQRELQRRIDARWQSPTEEQLSQHYAASAQRYRRSPAVHLALIQFGAAQSADVLQQAADVAQRLESGDLDFATAARRYSQHPSATDGGDVGWLDQPQVTSWGTNVVQALRQLAPGQRTGLIHTENGLWLFELRGRRESSTLTFEDARPRVVAELEQLRKRELENTVRAQQIAAIGVEIPAIPEAITNDAEPRSTKTIRWSTATEFENYGYHVYRGLSADGPFERLTTEPVPGAGTTDVPHSYSFEDVTVEPDVQYFYFVESISMNGDRKRLTPVQPATVRGSDNPRE